MLLTIIYCQEIPKKIRTLGKTNISLVTEETQEVEKKINHDTTHLFVIIDKKELIERSDSSNIEIEEKVLIEIENRQQSFEHKRKPRTPSSTSVISLGTILEELS